MSVTEIPLDAENTENTENNENTEIIPENNENTEIIEENTEPIIENSEENIPSEEITETVPAPKRPRGRPKKEAKPKEAVPCKAKKESKNPKPKTVSRPKKRVKYESSSSSEELPAYVRQEVAPQQDLASQMLRLLQNHESIRSARKRQLYASWFAHH